MKSLKARFIGQWPFLGRRALQAIDVLSTRLSQLESKVQVQAKKGCMPVTFSVRSDRPSPALAELLTQLPKLTVRQSGTVDFDASDATLLADLAAHADASCKTVLRGMSAIGSLMAHTGPEVEDGALAPDAFEALGVLLSELSELSGMLMALQTNCRRSVAAAA